MSRMSIEIDRASGQSQDIQSTNSDYFFFACFFTVSSSFSTFHHRIALFGSCITSLASLPSFFFHMRTPPQTACPFSVFPDATRFSSRLGKDKGDPNKTSPSPIPIAGIASAALKKPLACGFFNGSMTLQGVYLWTMCTGLKVFPVASGDIEGHGEGHE